MKAGFGTSGLRGKAEDLLAGIAVSHVRAFCRYCIEHEAGDSGNEIYVGRDLRESSPALASMVLAAIGESGLRPIDCGAVPTPALACFAMTRGRPSIMVTGSHIPADRNGLKFHMPDGEISKEDEAAISRLAGDYRHRGPAKLDNRSHQGTGPAQHESQHDSVLAEYHQRYRGLLPDGMLNHLKVGIYDHSSVATPLLSALISGFGAEVVEFGRSREFVPVDTEALNDRTAELLKRQAEENRLDAIISTDADGDRPLIIGGDGRQIPGDLAGWLTAHWIGAGAIATPVTSNSAIRPSQSMEVRRTRVGSPHVIAALEELTAVVAKGKVVAGFEANGGFLLATSVRIDGSDLAPLPTRDSVLPILAVLAHSAGGSVRRDQLEEAFGFKSAHAGRIENFPSERSAALMQWLGNSAANLRHLMQPLGGVEHVDFTDGLRITTRNGRTLHLRPSGNAPEMRIYCEAENAAAAEEMFADARSVVSTFITNIPGHY